MDFQAIENENRENNGTDALNIELHPPTEQANVSMYGKQALKDMQSHPDIIGHHSLAIFPMAEDKVTCI